MNLGYRSQFNLTLALSGLLLVAALVSGSVVLESARRASTSEQRLTLTAVLTAQLIADLPQADLPAIERLLGMVAQSRPGMRLVLTDARGLTLADTLSLEGPGPGSGLGTLLSTQFVPRSEFYWVQRQVPSPRQEFRVYALLPRQSLLQDAAIRQVLLMLLGVLLLAAVSANVAFSSVTRSLRGIANFAQGLIATSEATDGGDVSRAKIGDLAGPLRKVGEKLTASVKALAHERNRFGQVLESLAEGVLALNAGREITLVNRAVLDLFDLRESPLGRTLPEAFRYPALNLMVQKAEESGSATAELELGSNEPRSLLCRATRLFGDAGVVVVVYDITELRRLQKSQREFIANASHELRTPVTIIIGAAETLLNGALEDPVHAPRFLQSIIRNSQRLSSLVNDLLDLSRIESGEVRLAITKVHLAEAVEFSISTLEGLARERNITVQADVPEELYVSADEKALDQVLSNLLENAIKYGFEGGRVWIRASQQEDKRVLLEVEDNGPGIPARDREKVFIRFYRVDEARVREREGTGLGLAISKHLVERMRGEIGLRPAAEQGSVFWVTLNSYEDFVPSHLFVG